MKQTVSQFKTDRTLKKLIYYAFILPIGDLFHFIVIKIIKYAAKEFTVSMNFYVSTE